MAGFRVLVVDDSPDTADTLAQLVQLSVPCEVTTAYGGEEACAKVLAEPPQVVILDISMPGLNGIEAARRIIHSMPEHRPLMVVMTGKTGVEEDLADIDATFDHAFAKPPDLERLVEVLRAEADRLQERRERSMRFDFGELFTGAARLVAPLALAREQVFSFDYRGARVVFDGDPVQFECSLHRLLCAAVDSLCSGFVIFTADVQIDESVGSRIVVTAAGTGRLCSEPEITAVLKRLALDETKPDAGSRPGTRSAHGICPNTGGQIDFAAHTSEGVLFRLHLARVPVTIDSDLAAEDAQGARAWIIDSQGFDSAWLLRRLQRMGWAVTRLNSCAEAADRVGRVMAQGRGPSLVVVVEDHTALRSTAASLHLLRTQLPESAKLVLAVLADSPTLRHVELPGIDICVYPFSPGELTEYTRNVSPSTAGPDTQFGQLSGASASRRSVLVVDDNEVNRIVACGLIEALGYEVTTASDGLDAIERCRHAAPNVVLMDLDMNVLGGVEATRRLRELQRAGRLAPFSILACTAQSEAQARALSNDAGMDGYLSKPLNLGALRDELNRVAGLR